MSDLIHTIVLVEEDDATRTFLADNLTADDFDVHATGDAERAFALCARTVPDAAVVDVNGGSGRAFARAVRAGSSDAVDDRLPLILLGTDASELEVLRAFEAGADDHLVKPVGYPELRARLRALLRRADVASRARPARRVGALRLNAAQRLVTVGEQRVELSQKEFALLSMLARDPMRVFTKEQLLREVWSFRAPGSTRTLDSFACRLRAKLGVSGERFVINVWGVGYRLTDRVAGEAAYEELARAS